VAAAGAGDDGLPPGASALIAPTHPRTTPTTLSSALEQSQTARDALVRDALILDFAGYHTGASDVMEVLRRRHPDDPLAALIEVEHRFWPQLYDVGEVRDDPRLVTAIANALVLTRAAYEADPDDVRSRALYGRALIHDSRRLALDGYLMKAGSRGENARQVLEGVVEVAPADHDSRYLLGNYYYWAGVLPAYLKYVNWLWFVPQGDRDEGLVMLREVSRGEGAYAESAQVMLSVIGSHHAPTDFDDAVGRLSRLHERYPKNVLIVHELIDVLFKLKRWDDLAVMLDRMASRADEPQPVRAYALVAGMWQARVALHQRRVDDAEQQLDSLGPVAAELPNWSHSWIDVMRGQIADLRGRRDEAKRSYERALGRDGIEKSQRAESMARAGLEAPFDPDRFEHPLLLTGD